MPSLAISCASKPPPIARGLPITVEYTATTTVADVKGQIAAKFPNFYIARQKLSLKNDKANLDDEKKIVDLVGEKGGELQVKDLGSQISWRTVFLIEYAGPLVIHPLIYHFPRFCVHRFSHGTMPFRNVFKNSAHYHILSGLLLAYDVYRPLFSATSSYVAGGIRSDKNFLWLMAGVWVFAEFSNLYTHLNLRSLRPPNSRVRAIPYGYGFSLVSCPNYFFETLSWTVVAMMTGSIAGMPDTLSPLPIVLILFLRIAVLFLAVSTTQMALWAIKKHKNYKKEFGKEYPRGRYAMIPFIL
ncbi:hypothetical protein C0992_002095 [Termitomyces sp. T32_za158]|nr:hypothetical protein C0992_002095 [Termitomyces sp. T32_za158]